MRNPLAKLKGGDMRSIGSSEEVAEAILKDPKLFGAVFHGMFDEDPKVRMGAADAAEKASRLHPEYLKPCKKALLEATKIEQQEVRWHVAQMLPRAGLDPLERKEAAAMLLSWMKTSKSRIVSVNSMQALIELSETDKALRPMAMRILKSAARSEIPALASRARRLIKALGANCRARNT